MTAALLLGVSMPSSPAAAKKKAPKLSTKKVSISVGQKKTIKLKNGKKAVWSIKSGKKVVSLSKKKKTSVVVKGKKAGSAVVLAKVGKKKLTCKVTVKAKKPAVTKAPAVTTAPNTNKPSTAPTATPTAVVPTPTANPAAGASKPTPKPTVAPEFVSSEFKYDGLDQSWIDKNIDPEKPVVALSFDDGPGGYSEFVDYGMQIQNSLKEYGAHATFFYIGAHIEHDEDSRNEVISAKEAGFEVANHSYDSNGLNKEDADIIKEKIQKTDALLKELTGYNNFLFRAPNVAYSDTMFAVIEKPFIDVSVWSNDYVNSTTKEDLVENVTKNLKDGDIINMHSVHEKTAQAVPEILKYCKDNGIQVVGVSELFAIKGKALMTGKKYNNAY